MISLAVTTSTATVGVAIGDAGRVVGFEQQLTDRRHAEELTPMIERVLRQASIEIHDLDRLVVDVGPGRFTGLRVGLATVRTLALALAKPVVALTSLETLAAGQDDASVLVSIDARRGEVFQQRFVDGVAQGEPEVGPPQRLAPAPDNTAVVGDGVDRYPEVYGAAGVPGQVVQADVMLGLAEGRQGVAGNLVKPLYLREPDANPNVKTRPRVPQK